MSEQDNVRQEMERLATARDEWRRTAYEITEQANKMRDNLIEERDIAKADFQKVVGYNTRLQDELDKARAEIEQLKQALHDARLENSGQAAEIEQLKEKVDQLQYIADFEKAHLLKRQEPSRLEIMVALLAEGFADRSMEQEVGLIKAAAITADAIIQASKEVTK